MTSCKNKRLIGPYLDGQLGDCKWLEEHIAECSECLAEYEAVQHIYHLAQKNDFSPPESSYWKKFGTRVIARIAARPLHRPKRYSNILDGLFARRLAVRLVTPLLVVLIAVLAVKLYAPLEKLRGVPSDLQVMATNQLDENNEIGLSETAARAMPDLPKVAGLEAGETIPAGDLTGSTDQEADHVNVESQPIPTSNNAAVLETNPSLAEAEVFEPANSDDLIASYLNRRPVKTSHTRGSGLSNGIWADLTANLKLTDFNTDQVIKFQIMSGSNPSLAPLSSYREAAGKFFAPEMSISRNLFELDMTNRWGYANGDRNFSDERLRHLKLELDLMREK